MPRLRLQPFTGIAPGKCLSFLAFLLGARRHLFVVLVDIGFARVIGFHGAHHFAVFIAFCPGHQRPARRDTCTPPCRRSTTRLFGYLCGFRRGGPGRWYSALSTTGDRPRTLCDDGGAKAYQCSRHHKLACHTSRVSHVALQMMLYRRSFYSVRSGRSCENTSPITAMWKTNNIKGRRRALVDILCLREGG